MWLAHHFPGLAGDPAAFVAAVDVLTPEQTRALTKAGEGIVGENEELRRAHTRVIARAAGMRGL